MGIDGLHPVLRPYLTSIDLSTYAGKRVGCDASAWLHRGAVGCAADLAQDNKWWLERGVHPPYTEFCLKMLEMLRSKGVKPVVVFDGGSLPAKLVTQQQRRARKAEKLQKARTLMAEGNVAAASTAFCATVDVTCEMAHELMVVLRKSGIDFIVAPYEADSQLAFLTQVPASNGGIAAVITEDSDLVTYGCPFVIFKADRSGYGQQLALADLFSLQAPPADQNAGDGPSSGKSSGGRSGGQGKTASFRRFSLEMLQTVCVLAGCDFLPSIKGVGVKKALELVRKYRSLSRVLQVLRLNPKVQVPPGYPEAAQKALWNFRHALVFDAVAGGGQQTRLNPLPPELTDAAADVGYLGPILPEDVARGIAQGKLQPHPPYEPYPEALPKNAAGPTALSGGSSWLASATRRVPDFIATAASKAAAAPFKPPKIASGFSQATKRMPLSPVNHRSRLPQRTTALPTLHGSESKPASASQPSLLQALQNTPSQPITPLASQSSPPRKSTVNILLQTSQGSQQQLLACLPPASHAPSQASTLQDSQASHQSALLFPATLSSAPTDDLPADTQCLPLQQPSAKRQRLSAPIADTKNHPWNLHGSCRQGTSSGSRDNMDAMGTGLSSLHEGQCTPHTAGCAVGQRLSRDSSRVKSTSPHLQQTFEDSACRPDRPDCQVLYQMCGDPEGQDDEGSIPETPLPLPGAARQALNTTQRPACNHSTAGLRHVTAASLLGITRDGMHVISSSHDDSEELQLQLLDGGLHEVQELSADDQSCNGLSKVAPFIEDGLAEIGHAACPSGNEHASNSTRLPARHIHNQAETRAAAAAGASSECAAAQAPLQEHQPGSREDLSRHEDILLASANPLRPFSQALRAHPSESGAHAPPATKMTVRIEGPTGLECDANTPPLLRTSAAALPMDREDFTGPKGRMQDGNVTLSAWPATDEALQISMPDSTAPLNGAHDDQPGLVHDVEASPSGWSCAACTLVNPGTGKFCEACCQPRRLPLSRPAAADKRPGRSTPMSQVAPGSGPASSRRSGLSTSRRPSKRSSGAGHHAITSFLKRL